MFLSAVVHVIKIMATGTDGGNGTDIREGLICPICMGDFGTVGQLLSHFEEAHNSDEDKDVLQSFKGDYNKPSLSNIN